jgi:hypothetical protein
MFARDVNTRPLTSKTTSHTFKDKFRVSLSNATLACNVKLKREHTPKIVFVYNKEKGGWTLMPADDIIHLMIENAVQILCNHKHDHGFPP